MSTLTASYELAPNTAGPAGGAYVHRLKLDTLEGPTEAPGIDLGRQLVKIHAAAFYNHVQVVQPLEVVGVPGVRAMSLWPANKPDDKRLKLDEAVDRSCWEPPQMLVYSICGGLLVSTCLNMAMDTERVIIPSHALAGAPEAMTNGDVGFRDYRRPDVPAGEYGGGHNSLVEYHLERLADRVGDVGSRPVMPGYVDQALVELLQSLPESMATA